MKNKKLKIFIFSFLVISIILTGISSVFKVKIKEEIKNIEIKINNNKNIINNTDNSNNEIKNEIEQLNIEFKDKLEEKEIWMDIKQKINQAL